MPETEIKASDLVKLMGVVGAAAGLYNALEVWRKAAAADNIVPVIRWWDREFEQLGNALRELGLPEVDDVQL